MGKGKRIDVEWLRAHYPHMTDIHELLDAHEREFGWRPAKTAVYVKANRLGIRKAPVKGRKNRVERPVFWSKEPQMEAWMLEHDHGQRVDALSEEFRERFGFRLARNQVNLFRASHGTQVRPSHTGGRPRVPVGTERAGKDGYVVIKVAEQPRVPMSKDNWRLKHVWLWEQTNGPLPDGMCVYFADGDKTNYDAENLVAVPRRLVGVMNALKAEGVGWHDRETLETVIAMAELRIARNDAIASVVRTCPCCGRQFTNSGRRRRMSNVNSTVCPECGEAGRKPPTGGCRRTYDHDEVVRLREAGYRNEDVASMVGCSRSTVSKIMRDHREREGS